MGIKGWVSKADASGLPKIGQAVLFNDEGWIRSFPVLPVTTKLAELEREEPSEGPKKKRRRSSSNRSVR